MKDGFHSDLPRNKENEMLFHSILDNLPEDGEDEEKDNETDPKAS